jgi:hypothetical protein
MGLPSEAAQKTLAARIVAQGMTVRQAEAAAKDGRWSISTPRNILNDTQKKALEDPNVRAAVMEMERTLGTRVRLMGDDLHGKIIIEYNTSDDLERIYSWIVGRTR